MAATSNPAIKMFLDQRPADLGASALSSLVQALQAPAVSADLAADPANAALLKEVLDRLLAATNDGAKATAVRLMCLEGLYWISAGASEAVCQGPLFLRVQQLNESFDAMMTREAPALAVQREQLAVLLLRCTGYTRLTAGDVLQQLCCGDERQVVCLLVSMLENESYEWPLLQAALRWLYELTTPVSYFAAPEGSNVVTTEVHAFQSKVSALLEYCVSSGSLAVIFAQLSRRWQRQQQHDAGGLSGLGRVDTVASVAVLTSAQQWALLQWAVAVRYLSVLVHNLSEYSDKPLLVKALQTSLLASTESQEFLSAVLVPFIMATVHAWERDRSSGSNSGGGGAATAATKDPYLNAAIAALRLLRFALYRSSSSSSSSATSTTANTSAPGNKQQGQQLLIKLPLLTPLLYLVQYSTRVQPTLKQEYPGMLVLLLVVQCCCNVNAATIKGGGTTSVDLASSFEVLIAAIANDKTAIRADSPYPASLAFAICFSQEESPYAALQNETVQVVHARLAREEAELQDDADTMQEILAMQEQLEYLQAAITQASLGRLLAELGAVSHQIQRMDAESGGGGGYPTLLGRRPSVEPLPTPATTPSKKARKTAKHRHPAGYCCQITKKLMREPVVLKNGHRFEFDALMDIVNSIGHVDPLTGEAVDEEVEVDEGLRQEIADYRVSRAAAAAKHH